jgi:hypothetical protein
MRYLFAGATGVIFSLIVMAVIDQPYALYISAIGSFVVGWFSGDAYNVLFKNRA